MSALTRLRPSGHLRHLRLIISPRTLLRWHADLVKRRWACPRRTPGRPRTAHATRALVLEMARDNGPAVVAAYKNLKYVERDFRHIKSDDLDLRPVFHRLEERVKAHVLICMLACYLTWHLRRAWAPLTFTDQNPPTPANPVAPARRSAAAQAKASYQYDQAGQPYHSFRGLTDHLATLTRNQVRFAGAQATVPMLTEPTSVQQEAFHLLGAPIPLSLKQPERDPSALQNARSNLESHTELAVASG